jgi:hypothetical protein
MSKFQHWAYDRMFGGDKVLQSAASGSKSEDGFYIQEENHVS